MDISLPIHPDLVNDRSVVVRQPNRSEFWKPCPGTSKGYLCCGYQIITPSTGCGMYCKYCILQAYFPYQCQILFENFDDLEKEIHFKLSNRKGVVRFGTGEFGDSLYSEHQLQAAMNLAALLEMYPEVIIEFKTKSDNIGQLAHIRRPQKVIIGFSLNTPSMIDRMEEGTSSLERRLEAARKCVEMGFFVAFHFDPMFIYETWDQEYREVVRSIFRIIPDYSKIAWCSLGGFRSMPSLKTFLKEKNEHLSLFSGEMILGADGKLRYFRPLRTALYKAMREEFDSHYDKTTLYLCMESPEVWKESGMAERIPEGLVKYLDRRAQEMLGVNQ